MSREILYQVKVGLEGITPLLHHKCVLGKKSQNAPDEDYSEEWRTTTHLDADGIVIMPSLCIEAMMFFASKNFKIGKMAMTKIVPTGATVQEFEVPILWEGKKGSTFTLEDIAEKEWIFTCPAVVGGKRILRIRTAVPIGWYLSFTVDVTNRLLTEDIVRDLFDRGGYMAGLLDQAPHSPRRPGKFGQFVLDKFEKV